MQLQSRFLIGQYFPGNSFVHQSHPVLKIFLVVLFCIFLFQIKEIEGFLIIFMALLLLFRVANISFKILLRGMQPILFLLGFTFLIHALTTQGEVLWSWGILEVSLEGLQRGFFYSIRLILVVMASSLLTLSTSSVEITYALDRLFRPLKPLGFPAQEFSLMLAVSLRFLPVLLEELEKLIIAQKMRGANFTKGSYSSRINAFMSLLIPLFQNALDRADQLALAMEVRGFDPDRKRSSYHQHHFDQNDWKLLIYIFAVACTVYFLPSLASS